MENILNNKKITILPGKQYLLMIDKRIKFYAEQNKMKLSKNYHDWPERSLIWKSKGIEKRIQIYLDKDLNKFLVWGCAFRDTIFAKRYWYKTEPLIINLPLQWNKIEKEFNRLKEILGKITTSQLIEIQRPVPPNLP